MNRDFIEGSDSVSFYLIHEMYKSLQIFARKKLLQCTRTHSCIFQVESFTFGERIRTSPTSVGSQSKWSLHVFPLRKMFGEVEQYLCFYNLPLFHDTNSRSTWQINILLIAHITAAKLTVLHRTNWWITHLNQSFSGIEHLKANSCCHSCAHASWKEIILNISQNT